MYSVDESIASYTLRTVYSSLLKLIFWGVPAFGFAYWMRQSSPFQYLGLSVAPSIWQWVWILIVTGLFLGAAVGFETVLGRKSLSSVGISFAVTISGVHFFVVSPLLEEILFRGLFLKEFLSLLPGWSANLLTSLLFVLIHLPFWLSHGGWTGVMLANVVGVLIFSLIAGWLYLRSSSIWPPTVAHIANNYVASLLVTGNT